MHQVIHIDQEFQGMRQPLDFGLRAFFAVTITGPADTSGYPTTITIDSIVADSGTTAPMGINLGAAKALSFVGRLTPKGEFRNQTASDSLIAQSLSPVVGSFKNFFPRLPPNGVTLGAAWTDTVTENDRAAGSVRGDEDAARVPPVHQSTHPGREEDRRKEGHDRDQRELGRRVRGVSRLLHRQRQECEVRESVSEDGDQLPDPERAEIAVFEEAEGGPRAHQTATGESGDSAAGSSSASAGRRPNASP